MDKKKKEQSEKLFKLEAALKRFWKDHGKSFAVNGRHTDVVIQPKLLLGNLVNPQVSRELIRVFLSQVTPEKIVNKQVIISPERIVIRDEEEKKVIEITDPKIIDSMINKITARLGRELTRRESKSGGPYLEPKDNGKYSYGEIKTALVEFLMDMEKHDSQNLLREATILLYKGSSIEELSPPKEVTKEIPENSLKVTPPPFNPLPRRRRGKRLFPL